MNGYIASLLLFCAIALLAPLTASAVTIPTVPVGNPGNAGDTVVMGDGTTGYGSVPYNYRIGTYEVTNAQYVEFLNAKAAASDPLGLYNANMGSGLGGISRIGSSGSYTYFPTGFRHNMPVNFVSWYDSLRFANWLSNNQGSGDTETGAYTLLGGTPTPTNGLSITRNAGATWFLTSENEWYKAAYYNHGSSSYFLYPTSSNTTPTGSSPTALPNHANHRTGGPNDLTNVGAYTASASPYGTFDQGGNLYEWNEALRISNSFRGLRGGSYFLGDVFLESSVRSFSDPASEGVATGFRVAFVPEPSSFVLAALGLIGLVVWGWRRTRSGR